MGKRFFIALCGLLTVWGWAVLAQGQEFNIVGVYADEDMSSAEVTAEIDDLVTIYVVLDHPYNPHRNNGKGEDIDNVGCYSFILDLSTNLEVVENPGLAVSEKTAQRPNCSGVCVEYRSCYGFLAPVGENQRITLKSFVLRYTGSGPGEIRLRPPTIPAVPDEMDFWYRDPDLTGWVLPMYPVTGAFETPVFVVNGPPLPTTEHSWGRVKSLYR